MVAAAVLLSLVLPDGLGDLSFGACAARELRRPLLWGRIYASPAAREQGEDLAAALLPETASSLVFDSYEDFASGLAAGKLDQSWAEANEIFLAPWVFGLADSVLTLARRQQRRFWALAEYGRGHGHLHSYSDGLGVHIPTGWQQGPENIQGGVFKTILTERLTTTDWVGHFQGLLSLAERPRLWWAYTRKDSVRVHSFRRVPCEKPWPCAAKLVPLDAEGGLASGQAQTAGSLLREKIDTVLADPKKTVSLGVQLESEVDAGVAGQLSQLLVHALSQTAAGPEVLVAPNAGLQEWAGQDTVEITSLELISPSGETTALKPNRVVFLVARHIPRAEMRSFLAQSEREVVATGDQSVAEAVLLGKVPFQPDAKVSQWRAALAADVATVPDLGQTLRDLLSSEELRQSLVNQSRAYSEAVEAQLGPQPTEEMLLLARAVNSMKAAQQAAAAKREEEKRWADEMAAKRKAAARKGQRSSRPTFKIEKEAPESECSIHEFVKCNGFERQFINNQPKTLKTVTEDIAHWEGEIARGITSTPNGQMRYSTMVKVLKEFKEYMDLHGEENLKRRFIRGKFAEL
ncbi:unnamed protein product [Effrenium voratum]|nr:unnamed protein product [Effrenium voratum]